MFIVGIYYSFDCEMPMYIFDTEEEAVDFFLTFFGEITKENCPNIVQGILYYDGGYCHYPEEVLGYV